MKGLIESSKPDSKVSASGLIGAAGWVALGLAVGSVVGQRVWPLALVAHFWPHLLVTLIVSGAVGLAAGNRRISTAQLVTAGILILLVAPQVRVFGGRGASEASVLVVMFANVERSNTETSRLLERVTEVRPDVLGLVEIDDLWLRDLKSLEQDYPHRVVLPRDDNFGIALLSRLPLSAGSVEFVGSSDLPSIFATVETEAGPWKVVVTHPIPPFNRFAFAGRNDQFAALADALVADSTRSVVLGDLNATIWSPYLREFMQNAGLSSAAHGLRALYTWPVGLPILALGLDHCLHTAEVEASDFEILEAVGSDHFPMVCRLRNAEPEAGAA